MLPSTRSNVDDILRWFFCPQKGSGSRWFKNNVKQWDMGHAKEVKHDSRFCKLFLNSPKLKKQFFLCPVVSHKPI